MAYAPNKVIINSNGLLGRFAAILAEFDTANEFGQEIVEKGWEKETIPLRDKMTPQCAKIDQALDEYLEFIRQYNKDTQDFIDNHP